MPYLFSFKEIIGKYYAEEIFSDGKCIFMMNVIQQLNVLHKFVIYNGRLGTNVYIPLSLNLTPDALQK